jgi:hypothetical protein
MRKSSPINVPDLPTPALKNDDTIVYYFLHQFSIIVYQINVREYRKANKKNDNPEILAT